MVRPLLRPLNNMRSKIAKLQCKLDLLWKQFFLLRPLFASTLICLSCWRKKGLMNIKVLSRHWVLWILIENCIFLFVNTTLSLYSLYNINFSSWVSFNSYAFLLLIVWKIIGSIQRLICFSERWSLILVSVPN